MSLRGPVLYVTTGLEAGGAERALSLLAPALAARGFGVRVASLRGPGRFGPELERAGVPVESLDLASPTRWPLAWARLRRLFRERAPALVHGWMYHGNLATLALPRGPRVVWGIRQSLADWGTTRARTRAVVRACAATSGRADAFLYNAHVALEDHARLGFPRDRAEVIPNGFDTRRFRPDAQARRTTRARLGYGDDELVVACLARWHPVKGHDLLFPAFAAAASTRPWSRLLLAGSGATDRVAGEAARRCGLAGRVRALGEFDDVPSLLAACDGAVSASRGEAFPNAVGEAMACALPVVATDAGDTARLVGDAGCLVPVGDEAKLAGALGALLDLDANARSTLGAGARARIEREFSLDACADLHASFLRRVLEREPR
ncbi:MAG TPA: glycosyltransferase [Candidatus Polarisedimenticolaceae bacterium]